MNADRVVPVAYAMHASPKRYALLIGAGISVAAGLPTASDVSGNMILAVARGRGEKVERGEKNEVCLAWFEETFGEPATFQRLMKELGISEGNRKDGLKKFISRTDENGDPIPGAPTAAHRAVVRLVKSGTVSLVITTNFDTLMEEALKAEFVPYEVITEESDVRLLGDDLVRNKLRLQRFFHERVEIRGDDERDRPGLHQPDNGAVGCGGGSGDGIAVLVGPRDELLQPVLSVPF